MEAWRGYRPRGRGGGGDSTLRAPGRERVAAERGAGTYLRPQPTIHRGSAGAGGPRPDRRGRGLGAQLREGLAWPPPSRRSLRGDCLSWLPRASSSRPCKGRRPLRTALHLTLLSGVAERRLPPSPAGGREAADPSPPPTDSQAPTPMEAQAPASPYSLSPS
ncbi:hypothetical protein NN561_005226 [Cricetulus griseus]